MSRPSLFLIDGIGPFFRGMTASRINWSKIPFAHLPEDPDFWSRLTGEFAVIADRVRDLGYRPLLDHLFTLTLLSCLYRLFRNRTSRYLPKFIRKSAMGIDSLFE